MARKKHPELTFQDHIAAYLRREHGYGVLEQAEITDTEHVIAEDHLWAFLADSQPETVKKPAADYGTDARDEVFSVQDMVAAIRARFDITDEEALYIREVTEEKAKDAAIRAVVQQHKGDLVYLQGAFQGQVNGQIQNAYGERGRYEELADVKYTDPGAIFDIMALTVIQTNLQEVRVA